MLLLLRGYLVGAGSDHYTVLQGHENAGWVVRGVAVGGGVAWADDASPFKHAERMPLSTTSLHVTISL